jgi:hypothetical protein
MGTRFSAAVQTDPGAQLAPVQWVMWLGMGPHALLYNYIFGA